MKKTNKKQNANVVGVAAHSDPLKQNGITLIALIITIIVMLILVGVTINVALNGGLFSKTEKAAYQTNVSTIKEQVALKKAEILANNNGIEPENYVIGLGDIGISDSLALEFADKLVISSDGKLYYIATEVTNEEEQAWLEEIGIVEYVESLEEPPTLELVQINAGTYDDYTLIGINITVQSKEQEYKIVEKVLQEELSNDLSLEENLLKWWSTKHEEGTYSEFEDIGMPVDELVEEYLNDIVEVETVEGLIQELGTYTIKKSADDTTDTFEYGGNYDSNKELEGIYRYHTLTDLECIGCCYSATQTGTYEITISFMDYVLTDTITIESF